MATLTSARTVDNTRALLAATVLSGVATFMIYPFVVLDLTDRQFSVGQSGLVVGVLAGTGQLASVWLGRVTAHQGGKSVAAAGIVVRGAGLLALALSSTLIGCLLGAAAAGLGSAAMVLSLKAELMRSASARRAVTLRSMAVNTGALVGPGIGGLLYTQVSFRTIVFISLAIFAAVALLLIPLSFHPPEAHTAPHHTSSEGVAAHRASARPVFVVLLILVGIYWLLYSQLALLVPLLARDEFSSNAATGLLFMFNALLILTCQYLVLMKWLASAAATTLLIVGFLTMAAAAVTLGLGSTALTLVAYVALFSVGEMLISPALDETASIIRGKSGDITSGFGTIGTVAGISSICGPSLFGKLLDLADDSYGLVSMTTSALAAVGVVGAIQMLRRREVLR